MASNKIRFLAIHIVDFLHQSINIKEPVISSCIVALKKDGSSNKFHIFLSHSHKNSEIANKLKEELELGFGLHVFIAHIDIEPSEEWISTIIEKLEECDVFMPLLTKEFKTSHWTDQETGIALLKGKVIVPIKIDLLPYGFIAKYQALSWDKDNFEANIKALIQTLMKKEYYTVDDLIESFANSDSFADAGFKSELLLEINSLTRTQINKIVKASVENDQIVDSWKARSNLENLFSKYWDSIDESLRNRINEFYNVV